MTRNSETELMRLAAAQNSVFSRRQAIDAGFSSRAIDSRLERGLWRPIHGGVYISAAVRPGVEQRIMAACLACGPSAVASYDSAAAIWELATDLDVPHVSVPSGVDRRRPGIVVHRRSELHAVTHKRFRVTTPMLTLVDLAGHTTAERLERGLDDFHRRGLISMQRLAEYLKRPANRVRPGSGLLREAIEVRRGRKAIASDLETLMFLALRKVGLPLPVSQFPIRTRAGRSRFIDFAYPDQRLAIEVDGFEEHGTREAFESDRARQNELEELRWHVLRFTWAMLRSDPVAVGVTVGCALGLAPRRWEKLGKLPPVRFKHARPATR